MLSTKKRAPSVLDLGAGTGLYSSFMIEKYPDAVLTLVDFSEEMLSLAKERFKGRKNTEFILGDYTNAKCGTQFDIVISALSIHHLNAGAKETIYKRIFHLLSENGEFLNADQIISPNTELQEKYLGLWMKSAIKNGFTEEEIQRTKQSISLDDPSTINDQLKWLKTAGFPIADCIYKYLNFAVFYAKK
jgi:tRNA (cmo5U34)-methyltransferase